MISFLYPSIVSLIVFVPGGGIESDGEDIGAARRDWRGGEGESGDGELAAVGILAGDDLQVLIAIVFDPEALGHAFAGDIGRAKIGAIQSPRCEVIVCDLHGEAGAAEKIEVGRRMERWGDCQSQAGNEAGKVF